jgi:cytochrome c553
VIVSHRARLDRPHDFDQPRRTLQVTNKLIFIVLFVFGLAAGAVQAGGDAARGAELSIDCVDCHGEDGKGDDETPAIAGMDEAEHVAALKAYASGERVDETEMMGDIASALSEQDMADLAAYYHSLGAD